MVRIAFDAMGGDHGPTEVVPGVLDYARRNPTVELILVGLTDTITAIAGPLPPNVSIVHAGSVIGMDEHPALALREKKDSSILVATQLVRDGQADAVVTAGHTGAGMAAGILKLGRLPGVERPGLAVQVITDAGPLVLIEHDVREIHPPPREPQALERFAGLLFREGGIERTPGFFPVAPREGCAAGVDVSQKYFGHKAAL